MDSKLPYLRQEADGYWIYNVTMEDMQIAEKVGFTLPPMLNCPPVCFSGPEQKIKEVFAAIMAARETE